MTKSCLTATLGLAVFVLGTPVLIIGRLTDGVLPVQSFDLLIAVLVLGWVLVCGALLRRDDALDSLTQPRFSLRWQADNLVAQSLLGAGAAPRQERKENDLLRVDLPLDSVRALLPPALKANDRSAHDADDLSRRIVPSLASQPASTGPEVLATEEYVVARGDTFWSISEYVFGDGRHWTTVQELNLGREVAPGVILNESHEPRIGWSILIPLVETPAENGEPASADAAS